MIAVPDITFAATANAVILAGHTPVFVDIELDTHFISLQSLTDISAEVNIAAVIAVNLYGGTGQLLKLKNWCIEKDIILIEDNAQGLGSKLDTRALGSFGHFSITSLYGNKTITSGEGGLLFSNDQDLLKRSYSLKNHGRDKKGTFIHESIGYNFCYSDLQASLAISQIDKIRKIFMTPIMIFSRIPIILNYCNFTKTLKHAIGYQLLTL
jgi:perosamine synthetase